MLRWRKLTVFWSFLNACANFREWAKWIDKLRNERLREFYIGAYRVAYYIVSECTKFDNF